MKTQLKMLNEKAIDYIIDNAKVKTAKEEKAEKKPAKEEKAEKKETKSTKKSSK